MSEPDLYELGRITWHSSGEDEGPDVGLSLGLGEHMLWLGEMPTKTLAEQGINTVGGCWWFVLYGKDATQIIANVVDQDAAREMFDRVASRKAPLKEPEHA